MTSALQDLLERNVASGTVPGVVASLGTAELEIVAVGAMSVGGAPMRADAIMRMKSMTKAVTTVAALRLVALLAVGVDDGVAVDAVARAVGAARLLVHVGAAVLV